MKKLIKKAKNATLRAVTGMMSKTVDFVGDERGVDIIVMIVVLAILMGIAIIFRDSLTDFVNKLFDEILAF